MLERLSQLLLTLLQFTRMALVFTAISNSLTTYLLATRGVTSGTTSAAARPDLRQMGLIALISIGLYGFGMSLNDIIDRRRDRQIASHRPLPSGRLGLTSAHVVTATLFGIACMAGTLYSELSPAGWTSLGLVLWTAFLICFYDFAGKYLVAPGLLTLGLIRFFHAVIPAPSLPLLWHPLTLFTHVALLSAVAYVWEEKRPALTRLHWWGVCGGIFIIDSLAATMVWIKSGQTASGPMWLSKELLLIPALMLAFCATAWWIRRNAPTQRQAGQTLMLVGLLWLIVYDAAYLLIYVDAWYAAAMLALMPASYVFVHLMRWWARLLLLSQQSQFKRVRNTPGEPGQP